ncbi:hypothetical protein GXW83_21100 [Streptacidiphilus sp. PB12-B1b]|uniref:hypothetical protein n=1 Tax=Streptacidiphilus sp. PB12-B1b TaxID=2705012 RepID=UPI0015F8C781|nr:hypothetical protein [Streptacidiphilus sp. PB12-B1b]QMU77815.1 hypothetical protein GXW83_21100 [Streptacidiphilus sp. PB12-B1b]
MVHGLGAEGQRVGQGGHGPGRAALPQDVQHLRFGQPLQHGQRQRRPGGGGEPGQLPAQPQRLALAERGEQPQAHHPGQQPASARGRAQRCADHAPAQRGVVLPVDGGALDRAVRQQHPPVPVQGGGQHGVGEPGQPGVVVDEGGLGVVAPGR